MLDSPPPAAPHAHWLLPTIATIVVLVLFLLGYLFAPPVNAPSAESLLAPLSPGIRATTTTMAIPRPAPGTQQPAASSTPSSTKAAPTGSANPFRRSYTINPLTGKPLQ